MKLLQAEKQQLLSRIERFEAQNAEEIGTLRDNVTTLTETLTELQLENEALQESLGATEERVQVSSDRQTLIDNTLHQAIATLGRNGIEVQQDQEQTLAPIEKIFEKGCAFVQRVGKLRVEKGEYFARDGSEQHADILRLSRVAAVSLDLKNGGALAPVDSGALKVVNSDSLKEARQLDKGNNPSLVGMFIFDPLDRDGQVSRVERTLFQTFLAGGYVMWPIFVLAVIALLIVLERFLVRVSLGRRGEIFVDARPIKPWMLQARMREIIASQRIKTVLVIADRRVETGMLVDIVDQCRLAGAQDVGVAVEHEI